MENNNFRKKTLDKVTNPEQLNDYIKVSNPGVWMILVAIIIFLIGVCAWGYFGRLETKISAPLEVVNGKYTAYVKESEIVKLKEGMTIKVDNIEAEIEEISTKALSATKTLDEYAMHLGGINQNDWVFMLEGKIDLEDGIYLGQIVIESIAPITFVFN